MKQGERTSFGAGDAVAIAFVILAALILLLTMTLFRGKAASLRAEIRMNGEMIHEMPLGEDAEFTVEGVYTNHVSVRNGQVAITESSCPGGDCMHSGWIRENGRSIICLPNRVEIRVVGGAPEENEVDAVVR